MWKLLLITQFTLFVGLVFGQDADPIFAGTDEGARAELVERVGAEGTNSRNAEPPRVFKYNPSDLKQFSGHALNFLRAKCPKVDANTIFQLQKFIGKYIAKKNPKPSDNPSFRAVLDSINTCAKKVEPVEVEPEVDGAAAPKVRVGLYRALSAIDSSEEEKKQEEQKSEPIPAPIAPGAEVPEPLPSENSNSSDGNQGQNPVLRSPFVDWAQNIVNTVTNFIRRIFGNRTFVQHREKRSTIEEQTEISAEEETSTHRGFLSFFLPSFFFGSKSDSSSFAPIPDPETEAQKSFAQFFSKVCRLYCSKCHDMSEFYPSEYMSAAGELRTFLFNSKDDIPADVKMVESAIEKYLTPEFMSSVMECF